MLSLLGPLWPRVVVLERVPFMGQINLYENDSYRIGLCVKKKKKKKNSQETTIQKCKYECSMNVIS